MTTSRLDAAALTALLELQDGLITLSQARALGLTPSALSRRVRSPISGWSRVLPHVYQLGLQDLTERQRTRAAVLFVGPGAVLTGSAALRWHRLKHLPDAVTSDQVDVICPDGRQARSHQWVQVHRSGRTSVAYGVDGVRTMSVTRSLVDAAAGFSYETLLAVLCAAVNSGRTSPGQLRDELEIAPVRGSGGLRRALAEVECGSRSFPEAGARQIFAQAGLPVPLINEAILVGGRLFIPDFRWGRVIVEVDSKAWHLLEPGAWQRTQERRAFLQAHGYLVIATTPEQLRESPELVIAAVQAALEMLDAA